MILFFYILKEFFKYVIGTIFLCIFLFILFDFFHKTTAYFGRYNSEAGLILSYYILQIPFQIVQAIPIASLLGSVITMVLLNRTQEIAAMRAAGMSPVRVGAPLLCGGVILGLTTFILSEFVVPYSSNKMHYITQVLIEGEEDEGLAQATHWIRKDDKAFNFRSYDPENQTLNEVQLLKIGGNFIPDQSIHAQQAHYLAEQDLWQLRDVTTIDFGQKGDIVHSHRTQVLKLALPIDLKKLRGERRTADEMSLRELSEKIRRGNDYGIDVLDKKIAWHTKCSYPWAAIIVSLLGLKFGYRSERTSETVRSVLIALAIGISYWFMLSAFRALGFSADIPPLAAGWSATLILGGIVTYQVMELRHA